MSALLAQAPGTPAVDATAFRVAREAIRGGGDTRLRAQ